MKILKKFLPIFKIFSFVILPLFFFCAGVFMASADEALNILPGTEGTKYDCKACDSEECKQYCGAYQLDDFLFYAVKFFNLSLGVIGSLALLMFVYGGVVLLISAGSEERVKKGRDILLAAVIGLFVVFGSYLIVDFTMKAVGVDTTKWNELKGGTGWFIPKTDSPSSSAQPPATP